MTDAELAAEQAYVDAAYERLDHLRDAARAVAAGFSDPGSTHGARVEQQAAQAHTRRRLAALDIGDHPLCFGRIDRAFDQEGDAQFYIGRLSVTDAEQNPLVVDWRAPVAEPFYRATGIAPMGVLRRRHFQAHGRRLVSLDDEVFDESAAQAAGLTVVGEAALLAALDRERTGRMGDIVATIQAEQDEAIRADLEGVHVVTGGPGTGKTAVALHRAAYLLYTHRRRLASQGMLLVGPSTVFLRYIDEVLPALGEDEVALATISALKPQFRVRGIDAPDLEVLKGDPRMAAVVVAAGRDREHALAHDLMVRLDGFRLRLRRRDSARIVDRVRSRRGTHNEKRPRAIRAVLDHLKHQYRQAFVREFRSGSRGRLGAGEEAAVAAGLARGENASPEWEHELDDRLRALPDVVAALERMWPVLTGAELVRDLFGFDGLVKSAAESVLKPHEWRMLVRDRGPSLADVAWTRADLPLIDEADALLGPASAARRARRGRRGPSDETVAMAERTVAEMGVSGFLSGRELAERYGGSAPVEAESDGDVRTFGHVLVDEAQDLTPMEWRMLRRRCPSGSFTLVGDPGQASRPGGAGTWSAIERALDLGPATTVELTVNYRTPAEIMDLAARVLAAAAPEVVPPRSVRESGSPPEFVAAPDLARAAADALADVGGTSAVISVPELHPELLDVLADRGARSGTEAIDAPIAILTPVEAKGLEFDQVIAVEPSQLVSHDPAGLRLLYVTLTRATRRLVVVHSAPLPEALTPA